MGNALPVVPTPDLMVRLVVLRLSEMYRVKVYPQAKILHDDWGGQAEKMPQKKIGSYAEAQRAPRFEGVSSMVFSAFPAALELMKDYKLWMIVPFFACSAFFAVQEAVSRLSVCIGVHLWITGIDY